MVIRFNSGSPLGVSSGYEGANVPKDGWKVPPVGILDVDKALFACFDQEIKFEVSNGESREVTKVPVIFAAGEKWAMLKKGRALRDSQNTLILPLVTIRRTGIVQDPSKDIAGRGINQNQGQLVIRRRLDPRDRTYQNLINKLGIRNQDNVSDDSPTVGTRRPIEENIGDQDVQDGGLLAPKLGNNVWEIITLPMQQFFTATYEIVFWTQYTSHMNQMIQKLMASYLPTGFKTLRLETPKGYWFVAKIQDEPYSARDNADDMSSEERLLQYKFTVDVPAYMVASQDPGEPSAARSHISAPIVSFAVGLDVDDDSVRVADGIPTTNIDPEDGADDPSRELTLFGEIRPRPLPNANAEPTSRVRLTLNPFTGNQRIEYLRIVRRDPRSGEEILIPEPGLVPYLTD